MPFEKVVDSVVKERNLARTPLFQVLFVLHNTPQVPALRLGNISLTGESFDSQHSKFDFTLGITADGAGLRASVQYSTAILSEATMHRMMLHFVQLLKAVVASLQQKIGALPMLSEAEKDQVVAEFNNTYEQVDDDCTIISLFKKQAALTPDAIALVFGTEQLTYTELDKRSDQLANYLQSRGVKAESIVPVCLHKSLELIIGILGVLKAGGAYVPVDPGYPKDRIRFMLQDTAAELLLTKETHIESLKEIFTDDKIIALDRDWEKINSGIDGISGYDIKPGQLAYVLYTSGSTGQPKGVAVQHDSLANHLLWFNRQYQLTKDDSSLLISSFSFDGSMTATWPVLLSGGTLHLPQDDLFDPAAVLQYISENSITYIKTLPGIFSALVEQLPLQNNQLCKSLRLIIVGGERMNIADFKTYINVYPNILFANHYGPTECTISSSYYLVDKSNIDVTSRKSIVGKPVANTQIYIVNEEGQLNPAGVPGEIGIAGIGVARGYWNQATLTAEKFVANPFGSPGSRMYKTGDIGRWLADGNIEYIGRRDNQVKIRGYRIELSEIEAVIQQSGLVSQAVVVAKEDSEGNQRLVAYAVADGVFDKPELISWLKNKLPEYMIPLIWIALEKLPLTPNGKVDTKALPEPDGAAVVTDQYVAARNETEENISKIWQELLHVEQVGIHDNFFELGGHSLLAIRVISAIRKNLDVELRIKDLFIHQTIASLAGYINTLNKGLIIPKIEVQERPGQIPLSFGQERLWFMDQLEGSTFLSPANRFETNRKITG